MLRKDWRNQSLNYFLGIAKVAEAIHSQASLSLKTCFLIVRSLPSPIILFLLHTTVV